MRLGSPTTFVWTIVWFSPCRRPSLPFQQFRGEASASLTTAAGETNLKESPK
jgi:hypothetical protein